VNINKPTQSNIDDSFIRTMADDLPASSLSSPIPPKSSKAKIPKKKLKPFFIILGLTIVLIVIGTGGFFYWLNYLKPIVSDIVHFECQDNQCISIEGEGENKCQDDLECQPIEPIEPITQEPIIPESLILADETKIIELIADQENLLLGQLNSVINEEQATSTIKRILVKIIDKQEERYIDLNTLILALNINIPENILSAIAGDYTLFLYKQDEGSRLGIVIEMGESETLVQDLNDWENTIIDDLNQLLLTEDILNAHSEEFGDKIYNETYIRYMNFPTPALTLDYGIVSGNLIIATSRESMFMVIDKLLTINNEDVDGTED